MTSHMHMIKEYIVACHLPRGSKLLWREDKGEELPKRGYLKYNCLAQAIANYCTDYTLIKGTRGV